MRSALLAAILALTGSAVLAQPAYPPCTHPGQDRCQQVGLASGMGHGHHWREPVRHMRHHHHRYHH